MSYIYKYLEKYGKKDEELNMEDLSFRLKFLPKYNKITQIYDSKKLKIHNHVQFNWNLGNKKALFYHMRQYYELTKKNVFEFLPLTFHIKNGLGDKEFKKFIKYFREREKQIQK